MRLWLIGVTVAAVTAVGCGGGGNKAEVPKNPVPREDPGQSATPGGKGAPAPGTPAAPQTGAKTLP